MAGAIRVAPLACAQDGLLTGFLNRLAGGSASVLAYHYGAYRDMLVKLRVGEPLFLGAWRGEELAAVLPGFVRRTGVGSVYCSLPFFGPNAGVLAARADPDLHAALLDELMARLDACGDVLSASIYTPFLFADFPLYDRLLPRAMTVERFTQYLELPCGPWDSKLRCDIRHAARRVTVDSEVTPERLERFYEIYRQNCAEAGIPLKPRAAVDFLAETGVAAGLARFYFASEGAQMIGGLLLLQSPATASYYLPCTLKEKRSLQSSSLLIDVALQEAAANGVRYWNWESSPGRESGVYRFKQKWNSREAIYRIYVVPFREAAEFRALGREKLAAEFPNYFVYPFNQLER